MKSISIATELFIAHALANPKDKWFGIMLLFD